MVSYRLPVVVMALKFFTRNSKILVFILVCTLLAWIGYWYGIPLWGKVSRYYSLFTDSEQIKTFIISFGLGAPLVFVIIQVFQVLLAPIPGEVTGFIGGYLFGAAKGFLFSSIGLTVGSWLNFIIGRFLGKRYVRKLIPAAQLNKFDTIIKRQGVIVVFLFFVFPGFPKDYLCLFLGLSAIPVKVFIIIAAIGRMPGTFILSLQGAFLIEQKYGLFVILSSLCLILVCVAYRYRENLYRWVERFNAR